MVYALDPDKDGRIVWEAPPPPCSGKMGCSPAQSAAVTVIPGVVFSGSLDGHLRAYSTEDGRLLWDFDTVRDFATVNGVKAAAEASTVRGRSWPEGRCTSARAMHEPAAWAAMFCWRSARTTEV
ncbi:MAG: PQQ-binding-like beta-propeller repeat protein [Bryobacteraceae bacterium]